MTDATPGRVPTKSDPLEVAKQIRRLRERVSRARIILETIAADELEDAANSLEQIEVELAAAEAEVARLEAVIVAMKLTRPAE